MSTVVLTLNTGDRLQLTTTIERLINLLDDVDGDADHEPDLGFCGIATGWRAGEETDDREGADERDADEAEYDAPGFIWGGQGL